MSDKLYDASERQAARRCPVGRPAAGFVAALACGDGPAAPAPSGDER